MKKNLYKYIKQKLKVYLQNLAWLDKQNPLQT